MSHLPDLMASQGYDEFKTILLVIRAQYTNSDRTPHIDHSKWLL